MPEKPAKKVALSFELMDLEAAVLAARGIAFALGNDGFVDQDFEKAAPRSIEALLVLVEDRIRLLRRAVSGSVDPALLHNSSNSALHASPSEPDLLLEAWKDGPIPPKPSSRASRARGSSARGTRRASR